MFTIGAIVLLSYAPANASATRVHVYTGAHRVWTHIAPLARHMRCPDRKDHTSAPSPRSLELFKVRRSLRV